MLKTYFFSNLIMSLIKHKIQKKVFLFPNSKRLNLHPPILCLCVHGSSESFKNCRVKLQFFCFKKN